MQKFTEYSAISCGALECNPRRQDVIAKKQEILTAIEQHYHVSPRSILFYGFTPLILAVKSANIYLTLANDQIKKLLDSHGVKYTYIESADLKLHKKKFDWVVASDEYFTFADSESEQKSLIEQAVELAISLVITTLRDYKNQDYKDREFSQPLAVHNSQTSTIFLEYHNYDFNDKNAWTTSVYEMQGLTTTMYGPYARRSMFFKQLAKFSIDAGAKNFFVHKNLMYKSLTKKNYEHVISIAL